MSSISVHPLTTAVGAVVEGIDIDAGLADGEAAAVRQALLDHGVIFLRGQDISADQLWAFMENFGEPRHEESDGTEDDTAEQIPTFDLSPTRYSTAVWHADTTSLARPPIVTALRAVELPQVGGDTCWSSMTAAYEMLSQPMRAMLDGLTAIHSVQPTIDRMNEEHGAYFEARYTSRHAREQVHPVVVTHPETGRKALYVSETFVTRIVELSAQESTAILSVLFRHIESPRLTVRWKWAPNDLAIWDNRAVQHYAVPDYETTRVMQRIVLAGARPGEASVLAPRKHA